ncbi:MAG: hypothetical protein QXH80_00880 [Candidatus Nanoarchaeia archaeon]
MAESKLKQLRRIAKQVIGDLKEDNSTLAIMLKGSCVTGRVWEESDVDLARIVKGKDRDVYWRFVEGVRVEISDISVKTWTKKKKLPNFEKLEPNLHVIAHDTKIVYDPKNLIRNKFKQLFYTPELKLYLMANELSDSRYYIKGTRKALALDMPVSWNEGLRGSLRCFAGALFALNEIPRVPRFWLDDIEQLKRTPKGFKQLYKNVLIKQLNEAERAKIVKQLWDIFWDVVKFCSKDAKKIVKKLGGLEKAREKLNLNDLQTDILKNNLLK